MSNNKAFIVSAIISVLTMLVVNISVGSYFEDSESFFNEVILEHGRNKCSFEVLTNDNLGLVQAYVLLQKQFPGISIYSFGKTFFLWIALSTILYVIIQSLKGAKATIVMIVTAILLLSDNLVFIHNVRASVLLAAVAFLFLRYHMDALTPSKMVVFYFLIITAALNRIEAAFIVCFLGAVYFLLFQRNMLRHMLAAIAIPVVCYFIYLSFTQVRSNHPEVNFIQYEKAIYHRQDFKLRDKSVDSSLSNEELKMYALALFMMDEPALSDMQYSDLVNYPIFSDYIFENPRFKEIYINKIKQVCFLVVDSYLPLLLGFLAISFLGAVQLRKNGRELRKPIMLFVCYLSIPLAANIITEVPSRFISPYFSSAILAMLLYMNFDSHFREGAIAKSINYGMLLLAFVYNAAYEYPQWRQQRQSETASCNVLSDYKHEMQNNNEPLVVSFGTVPMFPAKLFQADTDVRWVSIESGPFNPLECYHRQKEELFGEGYRSLKKRFEYAVTNNTPLYGNDFFMRFYQIYLDRIHDFRFEYEEEKHFEGLEINKYRVFRLP